jgi:peroxiredoxin
MSKTPSQPMLSSRPSRLRLFGLGAVAVLFMVVLTAGLGGFARNDHGLGPRMQDGTSANLPKNVLSSPSGSLEDILARPDIIPSHDHALLGQNGPDFELADSNGKVWKLSEALDDGPLVLIFYYGYHCVACVRQLFDVNNDLPLFREVSARVVAISADPPELTRRRFQEHGPFGFPVLSDPGNKVAQAYRVFRPAQRGQTGDLLRHGVFVIDQAGTIQWVNVGDAPLRRNSALLYQLSELGR